MDNAPAKRVPEDIEARAVWAVKHEGDPQAMGVLKEALVGYHPDTMFLNDKTLLSIAVIWKNIPAIGMLCAYGADPMKRKGSQAHPYGDSAMSIAEKMVNELTLRIKKQAPGETYERMRGEIAESEKVIAELKNCEFKKKNYAARLAMKGDKTELPADLAKEIRKYGGRRTRRTKKPRRTRRRRCGKV